VRLKGTGQSGCLLIPARISRARSSLRVAFREAWPFRFARVASCAYGRGRRARSRECSTHLSCSAIGGCSFACACRTRRVRWVGLLNDRGKRTDDLIGNSHPRHVVGKPNVGRFESKGRRGPTFV
jgi:hypothetical protein